MSISESTRTESSVGGTPSLRRVILLAGFALICGFALARWMEHRQSNALIGRLHAHETVVTSPQPGRIREISVSAGQVVEAKKRLLYLVDDEVDRRRELARQRVATLELELAQAQAKSEIDLAWRLRAIEGDRHETRLKQASFLQHKLDSELRTAAIDEQLKERNTDEDGPSLVRRTSFSGDGETEEVPLGNRLEREASVNAMEVATAQVSLCDQRLQQLDRLADQLPARLRRATGVDALETRLAKARADLERSEAESATVEICAPTSGTVGRWEKRVGDGTNVGEPLVTLFDEGRRYVLVHIPAHQAGPFVEGTPATLVFPGHVKRKGVVSTMPQHAHENSPDSDRSPRDAGSFVTVRIETVDQPWPESPIGSAVEVRPGR